MARHQQLLTRWERIATGNCEAEELEGINGLTSCLAAVIRDLEMQMCDGVIPASIPPVTLSAQNSDSFVYAFANVQIVAHIAFSCVIVGHVYIQCIELALNARHVCVLQHDD